MKVSRASQTTGPIGVVIDVDRSRLGDGLITVCLSGDLDVLSIPRLRAVLGEVVGRADLVLDLRHVGFCDSSALRVFLDAERAGAASGHHMEIRSPSRPVRRLLDQSGLGLVLQVS